MLTHFYITGDPHGNISHFRNYFKFFDSEDSALIILGDLGANYYCGSNLGDSRDELFKTLLMENSNGYFYAVRGNHEERPENLPDIVYEYDENIKNDVMYQKRWPRLRYLADGFTYDFGGHKTLVIGGAYSVDKNIRLYRGWSWFPQEQLTEEEREEIYNNLEDNYDFLFTHTCPFKYEPSDLFLDFVNQKNVDKSMEKWLDKVVEKTNVYIHCFGHYHADRIERPYVEQYYHDIENIEDIYSRWKEYDKTQRIPWDIGAAPGWDCGEWKGVN